MSLTSLLVVLDGDESDDALCETALKLARERELFVDMICVRPSQEQAVPVVADGLTGGAIGEIVEALEARSKARVEIAEAMFQKYCKGPGLPLADPNETGAGFRVAFEIVEGLPEQAVAWRGRHCDLIAVSRPHATEDRLYAPALEAALFESGRPVLMVPLEATATVATRAFVAWNDSAPSARAVAAAMPMLRQAESVEVVVVRDAGVEADPEALRGYLSRHGLSPSFKQLEPDYRPLGEQLLDEAKAGEADLLVMGAYGHSRLRELVLGGVTRQILALADISVLMAH